MVWQDMVIRLCIAIFAGAFIGTERQWRHRMAGLRTNALVSLGACLFVLLSVMVVKESSPTRIAAQVVSGIGFLGGGVIIREGFSIHGLNTAATLWCAAAVGTLVGSGFLTAAILGSFGVLLANILLRPVALFMNKKSTGQMPGHMNYVLSATCLDKDESHIRALLMHMVNTEGIDLKELYSEDIEYGKKVTVRASLHCDATKAVLIEKLVSQLSLEAGITAIGWKSLPEQEAE
ncbi:MgtC/SapB family protein [Ectobacillus panaciterrae]|uniref:MgtC/SapB family protein n=1 Tax=Ectobacillus panaciterrae TaxID=363872 RepID=UPI0004053AB3|nr:MgtC/SapB family protein [Ectobacillus panaciterrae]